MTNHLKLHSFHLKCILSRFVEVGTEVKNGGINLIADKRRIINDQSYISKAIHPNSFFLLIAYNFKNRIIASGTPETL